MGTTRMHSSPHHGVVNEHCRAHDFSNLYIAGTSVFPTGGVGNPTLSILALTLRLADCLRERFLAARRARHEALPAPPC
jgi:choline dehydrogenase-like flavoprotein